MRLHGHLGQAQARRGKGEENAAAALRRAKGPGVEQEEVRLVAHSDNGTYELAEDILLSRLAPLDDLDDVLEEPVLRPVDVDEGGECRDK
ncbi:hypothetical protein HYQ46_011229 [Verticillium longisporum]|nr:hypothetical protein HYQ46_011229 [Verticillium longisporum]